MRSTGLKLTRNAGCPAPDGNDTADVDDDQSCPNYSSCGKEVSFKDRKHAGSGERGHTMLLGHGSNKALFKARRSAQNPNVRRKNCQRSSNVPKFHTEGT